MNRELADGASPSVRRSGDGGEPQPHGEEFVDFADRDKLRPDGLVLEWADHLLIFAEKWLLDGAAGDKPRPYGLFLSGGIISSSLRRGSSCFGGPKQAPSVRIVF